MSFCPCVCPLACPSVDSSVFPSVQLVFIEVYFLQSLVTVAVELKLQLNAHIINMRSKLMAEWLEQASELHEIYCDDLKVMSSNPSRGELGVYSIFILSCTWTENSHLIFGVIKFTHQMQNLVLLHYLQICFPIKFSSLIKMNCNYFEPEHST